MENQEKIIKKPKWLRKLEKQSWQAELIVSGLAIYGAIQFPELVNRFANWALLNQSDNILSFGSLFFLYLNFASIILVVGLIIHFIMRTLWIGMIGLVSVYPKGVVKNLNRHSESFADQLVKEFNDINVFNKKLDDTCSVILSITIVFFLMMLIFNFWLFVGLYFWIGLKSVLGDNGNIVFIIITSILAIFFLLMVIMNDKKHRDKEWAKKFHYPMSSIFTKVFLLFFYRTYAYISYTIATNVSKHKEINSWKMAGYGFGIGMAFGLLGFFSASISSSTNQELFSQDTYFRFQSYPDESFAINYQSNHTEDEYQFGPSIQSDAILDNFLRIQIPIIEREELFREELCGEYVNPNGTLWERIMQLFSKKDKSKLSRLERRKLKDTYKIECAQQYYSIYVDDFQKQELQFSFLEKGNQWFYLAYIPIEINRGNHTVKIERAYKNEDGENAVQYINFFKE